MSLCLQTWPPDNYRGFLTREIVELMTSHYYLSQMQLKVVLEDADGARYHTKDTATVPKLPEINAFTDDWPRENEYASVARSLAWRRLEHTGWDPSAPYFPNQPIPLCSNLATSRVVYHDSRLQASALRTILTPSRR